NIGGRIAKKQTQRVLGEPDLALCAGNLYRRVVEKLFGLVDFERSGDAAVVTYSDEAQIIRGNGAGLAADFEFEILFAQAKVSVHYLGGQRKHHAVARLFACQVQGSRRLVQPPQTAPQIQLPGEFEAGLGVTGREVRARANKRRGP